MRKNHNIWVIFSSRKGGHTYPSRALVDYINKNAQDGFHAELINLLDLSPLVSNLDKLGRYGDLKLKWFYKKGYQNLQKENQTFLGGYRFFEGTSFKLSKIHEKLCGRFGKPGVIITLQPEVNAIAPLLKNWFAVPIHTIIVDLAIHGLWINKAIDHYYVPNEPLKQELIKYRVPSAKISITGMPLRAGFTDIVKSNKKEVREDLGIARDLPTILLMAGLLGTMIDFLSAIKSIIGTDSPFQLLVVFGKNEAARREANLLKQKAKSPVHLFGTVDNIHEMMWASDLVISKPGSVTMAEALSLGKPMIVITPRAGSAQEMRFAKFLKENGAGEWLDNVEQLGVTVSKILNSQTTYQRMSKQAWVLGHHSLNATREIFDHVKNFREVKLGGKER